MTALRVLLRPFVFICSPFVSEDSCPLRHDIDICIGLGAIPQKTGIFTDTTVTNLDVLFERILFRIYCNVVLFENIRLSWFTNSVMCVFCPSRAQNKLFLCSLYVH